MARWSTGLPHGWPSDIQACLLRIEEETYVTAMHKLPRKLSFRPSVDPHNLEVDKAIARLRKQFVDDFEPAYVDNVLVPYFLSSTYEGERLSLPMIDPAFTKENAILCHLWGLLSDTWKPSPEDGVSVYLQGLEKRGPDNRRKKIYMSALTPDLYRPMYADKINRFFDALLDETNAGKPLMRRYLEGYSDLFWDLHLGISGDAIPTTVRQAAQSISTVLAYSDPTQRMFYEQYMTARAHGSYLKHWIDERIADLMNGTTADPDKTFVYYWIKNGGEGDFFRRRDVVFECIHNFFAVSEWGTTIYNIMLKLSQDTGDPDARAWFKKTMESNFDAASGAGFTRLERFVMELFRTISPNTGSISTMKEVRTPPYERHGYLLSPHAATSFDPRHWKNPGGFDPDRYVSVPTSQQIDESTCEQIGFSKCPFEHGRFQVMDGRAAALHNSGFGTVYGIVDGKPQPLCDYAGYAPFGFGYRRCPGEQLTVHVFRDFLRKVWETKTEFRKLDVVDAEQLPIGPGKVIDDNIGFTRTARG
jgi:cytochrome P450